MVSNQGNTFFESTGQNPEIQNSVDNKSGWAASPDHVLPLGDTPWVLWRCFGLRGAGFPAATLLDITPLSCATTADEALRLEEEMLYAQKKAYALLEQRFIALSNAGEESQNQQYHALLRAKRLLKKKTVVNHESLAVDTEVAAAIDAVGDLTHRWYAALEQFHSAFAEAVAQENKKLCEVVKTDRFREAVLWQNRRALHCGLASLQRSSDEHLSTARQRQNLLLAAMYLQRYCMKNDTIGFFGPVGWGHFVPEEPVINVQPGQTLLARRTTYFEYWGIQVLAEVLARNKQLLPWIAPRCMPFVYLDGTVLKAPFKVPLQLSMKHAVVLQSCHYGWTAHGIAARLLRSSPVEFKSETEIYLLLESLRRKGLITWTFEVPIEAHAEKILRQQLERIDHELLRAPLLEALDELEHAREGVEHAAGNVEQLDQAIEKVETTFVKLTGTASTRRAGEMYAARTLIYEDCQRDLVLELGPSLIEALAGPLSQILTSGRWLTHKVAHVYRNACQEIYHKLVNETGSSTVSAVAFWQELQARLADLRKYCHQNIVPLFQERWACILSISMEQHIVKYRSQDIQPQVQALFAAPHAGYDFARYHSPDIMIAAHSVEAIRRNDYLFVLGEIHFSSNTLLSPSRLVQHPSPDELIRAYELDMPGTRLIPVPPTGWPEITTRGHSPRKSLKDYRLILTPGSLYSSSETRDVPIGALVVEEGESGLQLRSRDGALCFDIIEVFSEMLAQWMPGPFKQLFPGKHIPRIVIDRLVICRESWQYLAHEIPFIHEKDDARRFIEARRWIQLHNIPRFVFASVPGERKPFYVDFASPIYINNFVKVARRNLQSATADEPIKVSEMLPDPMHLWLPDAQGNRYTSELRIIGLETAVSSLRSHSADQKD